MPIRDWGIGLEELTEYYHRYGLYYTNNGSNESQNWFMARGLVDQSLKYRKSKTGKQIRGRSPVEIDLVGVNIGNDGTVEEVRLIQCTESIDSGTLRKKKFLFQMPRLTGLLLTAEKKGILKKFVSYVTITRPAKEKLQDDRVGFLPFDMMAEKLIRLMVEFKDVDRKGFAREPPLWLIRSLLDKGFFDKKFAGKIN